MPRVVCVFALAILTVVPSVRAQEMKVMTYNIRLDIASDGENAWPERREFLVDQIRYYEPDILGIQEGLPQQVQFMKEQLDHYSVVGIGREGEGKGEYSAIFYKTKKYTVRQSNTFWLSETPAKVSKGWDAAYLRVCTYALFSDNKTREEFWVFNTHLDNTGEEARRRGIDLIESKMKEVNVDKRPVILTGDFNSPPESDLIVALKREMLDTRDACESKPFGPMGSFNGFHFDKPVTLLIDYIFISRGTPLRVIRHAVLTDSRNLRYPSDHFPVLVNIQMGKVKR